jgi:hypothetical protein
MRHRTHSCCRCIVVVALLIHRLKEFYRLRRRLLCVDEGLNGGIETVFRFPVGSSVCCSLVSVRVSLCRCACVLACVCTYVRTPYSVL